MNGRPAEEGVEALKTAGYLLSPAAGDPVPPTDVVGGKAHNLARLARHDVAVPPWFVVTTTAFRELVRDRLPPPAGVEDAAAWRASVRGIQLPRALREELEWTIDQSGFRGRLLAVRSSAVAEDSAAASYAGQFESRLGVRPEEVAQAILEVWASAGSPHALAYGGDLTPMAVLVQAMVDPSVSGVAFGVDPVAGDPDTVVISAVWGLGEGLVSGELDADHYRVRLDTSPPRVTAELASKTHRLRLEPGGGIVAEALPASLADKSRTLDDERCFEIARATRRLGESLGAPVDVEWAIEDAPSAQLWILQARPITALAAAGGERRVWDNSNIIESYAGVTSPLTFSFARSVYEEVYRQFCQVVGVPHELIERHRHVFANMLGLVRGRVYYNLLNWYRTLALLPGYAINRAFMERMMGVREKLSDPPVLDATSGRAADALRTARMVGRLVRQSRGLATAVPEFHAHVDRVLLPTRGEDLTTWSADRLAALYRSLEEELLRKWETPLVNDFFAMLWFGLLGRLVESWLRDAPISLANDLLVQEGGIVSAEPAEKVRALARTARADPAVWAHFEAEPDASRLARSIAGDPACAAFMAQVEAYLARFGDRCMNELKLESVTLADDPAFLFEMIRAYVDTPDRGDDDDQPAALSRARSQAEALVEERLGGVRRRVFNSVLANARARVRDRENLRFERTRVFGVVRRIFLGFGHHLVRTGKLDDPREIFYLRVEEVFGYVDGTLAGADLRSIVRVRGEEWQAYESMPPPPDRFESIGPVSEERWIVPARDAEPAGAGDLLQGIGCSPGRVRAAVRLVRDPRDAGELRGRILVAERTDPGWTLLFPVAVGILVERGSLLSHSAIVAREMGIPCVVSIPGLTSALRDGEVVEMDGTTGTVRRVDA